MTDSFSLLNEPRLPWLDADALKAKFHQFSAEVHPDRSHNAPETEKLAANGRYAELNAAYNTLREPKDRLLHLLELELGGKPRDIQRIPPGTMDLFVEVGQTCKDVDAFLAGKAEVTSPMLKVKFFQQSMLWTDKLQALQTKINGLRDSLTAELQQMNAVWQNAPAVGSPERAAALPLERLEQVYRAFSYVARWSEQIQERHVQLAF
jgi:curved DNA-binding protein CbpA